MTKPPLKQARTPARVPGNLEGFMQELLLDQLRKGAGGNTAAGREAHATLAAHLRESNIPEPYRDCLVWMHQAIANGMDAADACAVAAKPGRFSQIRRDIAIWQAIDEVAFEDKIEWRAAAAKLHGNARTLRRMKAAHPDLELPASLETVKNIYRRIDKAAHE